MRATLSLILLALLASGIGNPVKNIDSTEPVARLNFETIQEMTTDVYSAAIDKGDVEENSDDYNNDDKDDDNDEGDDDDDDDEEEEDDDDDDDDDDEDKDVDKDEEIDVDEQKSRYVDLELNTHSTRFDILYSILK